MDFTKPDLKARCYNDKTDFGVLKEYKLEMKVSNTDDVQITIGDGSTSPSNGDKCFLMSDFKGVVITLKDNNNENKCDICSTFYYDPASPDKKFYIKDIFLNRVEYDSSNKVVTIGYYKIQSILDQYYSTSKYPILLPLSYNDYKGLIKVNEVLEVQLELRGATDNPLVTETTSIESTEKVNGDVDRVNVTVSTPMLKLKSKYNDNRKLELVLINKITKSYECVDIDNSYSICHHHLLKLNLGWEGGSVILTKKYSGKEETKISGDVISYKSSYPQECYIKYSEVIKEGCEYSNFVVASKRNDLSLYNNAVVVDRTITWKKYGNAVSLMGIDSAKTFMCLEDGKLVDKTASLVSVNVNGDVVFTFSENQPQSIPADRSICYLVYKVGDTTGFDFSKSDASKLYKDENGEWVLNTPKENEIKVTIPTVDKSKKSDIRPVVDIDAGKTVSNKIVEKSKESENDEKSSYSPIPIPEKESESQTVTSIENKVNKISVYVEVYKNVQLVLKDSALISEYIKTEDGFIIVKTTPVLDIAATTKLRQLTGEEYRVIISLTQTTVNSLYIEGLDLNFEGGSLYCHNNEQGWDGVVDVIYYDKYLKAAEGVVNMHFISQYDVMEGDTLTCEVRFKRNDLSLYAKSVVKDNNKITWSGYKEGFTKLITGKDKGTAATIPLICYNPKDKNNKLLSSYTGAIDVTGGGNDVIITVDKGVNGTVCFPASKSSNIASRLSIDNLDVRRSCTKGDDGKWYYGTIDGKPVDIKDKDGNPLVSFDTEETNEILGTYETTGELHIPVDISKEVSSLFTQNANPGMTLEVWSEEILIDSGTISSVRKEGNNLIIIKTVNKLDIPTNNSNLFNSRRLLDQYSGEPIRFVVRPNDGNFGPIECSGQGQCDRSTGQCKCYKGFTGKICDRIECPNNCNGNGRCVLLNELLSDSELKNYEGYGNGDRIYGCLCDKRHRGYDCSLIECPSSVDPLNANGNNEVKEDCSGRGLCDYKTGICKCFPGFSGEGCQYMTAALQ